MFGMSRRLIMMAGSGLGLSGLVGPIGLLLLTGHGADLARCARPVRDRGTSAVAPAVRCVTGLVVRVGGSLVGMPVGAASMSRVLPTRPGH